MLNTQSVKHAYKKFFLFTDDYLDIATLFCRQQSYSERLAVSFVVSLRVLETWKNDLLCELDKAGVTEEQLTEEMLWMDTEWSPFCTRALHIFEARTFQNTLPRIIEAGFARQRYIKRDADGQRVCDEAAQPLTYATYQEARDDKQHPGAIIHQVLFLSNAVNEAIARLSPAPTPPPSPDQPGGDDPKPDQPGGDDPEMENGDAHEQGGNLVTQSSPVARDTQPARGGNPDTGEFSNENIPHPSHFCEGESSPRSQLSYTVAHNAAPPTQFCAGSSSQPPSSARKNATPRSQKNEGAVREASQKCEDPVRKNASNKDNKEKNREESLEESITGAGGAGVDVLSHFDFFQDFSKDAILDLTALIMPLPAKYESESRKQEAQDSYEKTAARLASDDFFRTRGLAHLARLLCYLKDPSSPCKWRRKIHRENPGCQIRLWHLTEKVAEIASKEMERADWWPQGLQQSMEPKVDEIFVIDLAELAGIAPDQRQGMDKESCLDLVAYLRTSLPPERFPGVFVDYGSVDRWQRRRGYFVELWYAEGQYLRLYSPDHWQLVASHAEALGTPDFVSRLSAALRPAQALAS